MSIESTILKPAKHGYVIDLTDGARRCQVRVFEFETQPVPGTEATCEMPVTIDEGHAIARFRQAQEAMREQVMDRIKNTDAAQRVPTEGGAA